MPRSRLPVKIAIALGLAGGLGFLFMRSVRGSRSSPYTVTAAELERWTLSVEPAVGADEPAIALRPRGDLVGGVYEQLFKRAMETMTTPTAPGIPLLLKAELDALAGRVPPGALMEAARRAGLDTQRPVPLCLAYRRVSDKAATRQVWFLLFELPAFAAFREEVGRRAEGAGFDPGALSPALIVAASGPMPDHWLPLHADATTDCLAPIAIAQN